MYRHLVACCPIAVCIYFDTNKICLNQTKVGVKVRVRVRVEVKVRVIVAVKVSALGNLETGIHKGGKAHGYLGHLGDG